MKYYDYAKAKKIIEHEISNGLVCASLGMHEDWFWTANTVWDKDNGQWVKELPTDNAKMRIKEYINAREHRQENGVDIFEVMKSFDDILIGGLCGSDWATPVLMLEYSDDWTRNIECYFKDGESDSVNKNMSDWLGVLSAPVQEHRSGLELESSDGL